MGSMFHSEKKPKSLQWPTRPYTNVAPSLLTWTHASEHFTFSTATTPASFLILTHHTGIHPEAFSMADGPLPPRHPQSSLPLLPEVPAQISPSLETFLFKTVNVIPFLWSIFHLSILLSLHDLL